MVLLQPFKNAPLKETPLTKDLLREIIDVDASAGSKLCPWVRFYGWEVMYLVISIALSGHPPHPAVWLVVLFLWQSPQERGIWSLLHLLLTPFITLFNLPYINSHMRHYLRIWFQAENKNLPPLEELIAKYLFFPNMGTYCDLCAYILFPWYWNNIAIY